MMQNKIRQHISYYESFDDWINRRDNIFRLGGVIVTISASPHGGFYVLWNVPTE